MTINEAIKILDNYHPFHNHYRNPGILEALNLGIEALKRLQEQRSGTTLDEYDFLPGETKD